MAPETDPGADPRVPVAAEARLADAPALAPLIPRVGAGRPGGPPPRVVLDHDLARLTRVLGSLRAARDPGPPRVAPKVVTGEWQRLLRRLDGYLDQPPRETPAVELVRTKITVETELDADARAWRLPEGLVARLRSRLAYLDHRLEQARAGLLPVPVGPAPVRLLWPMSEVVITSQFGWREDPINGRRRFHYGIDLGGDRGAGITSAGPGIVTWAGWNGGHGRHVEIVHPGGWVTRYSHLGKILVHRGDRLEAGDLVGTMGASGRVTGPHLHFEVWRGGDARDPMHALGDPLRVVTDEGAWGVGG